MIIDRRDERPSDSQVAVVGAGVGGLCAALRLRERGFGVDLYEASGRAGGTICSVHDDGWRMEFGPNTLPDRQGLISALIAELGLEDQRLRPNERANKRYVVRGERLVALPRSPAQLWATPLLSQRAKLRLLAEPLVPGRDYAAEPDYDESLYNLTRRRLGAEVADYAIDPFIAGTYGGDPRRLSSRMVLGRLAELEREAGSLLGGGLRAALAARASQDEGDGAPGRGAEGGGQLVNFERGVQTLTDALAARLGECLHLDSPVEALTQDPEGGWQVHVRGANTPASADAVVVAIEGYKLAELELRDAHGERLPTGFFGELIYPPMSMLALGFRRSQIEHPLDGFGMLVPSAEPFGILGAVFTSTIFARRAPEGHVLMMAFVGGRDPELAMLGEGEQLELVMRDLDRLLGIQGQPIYARRRLWERSIPQYEVGYERFLERVDGLEARAPGLFLTGNWRDGISVADVVRHASETAHSAARYLHP